MGKQKEGGTPSKQEERENRRRARAERHVVVCPHCGKNVLDHQTQCPYCKGVLVPQGYRPVDPEKYKKIRLACMIVGIAVAIAVFLVIFLTR